MDFLEGLLKGGCGLYYFPTPATFLEFIYLFFPCEAGWVEESLADFGPRGGVPICVWCWAAARGLAGLRKEVHARPHPASSQLSLASVRVPCNPQELETSSRGTSYSDCFG